MYVIKHILISFLNRIEYLLPMKPKSKALTIGGAWLVSNVMLFTAYCDEYSSIKIHNDYGRKQAVLPLIKEEFPSAATENMAFYPIENEKNCPKTTDSEAALLAKYFKSKFINLTNVNGLYNKDPRKYKDAKFTPKISWKEFHKIANLMSFKPGQHFILDQKSSKIIMKYKIPTYIIGKNTNDYGKTRTGINIIWRFERYFKRRTADGKFKRLLFRKQSI